MVRDCFFKEWTDWNESGWDRETDTGKYANEVGISPPPLSLDYCESSRFVLNT